MCAWSWSSVEEALANGIVVDDGKTSRALIDEATGVTFGAGMINSDN